MHNEQLRRTLARPYKGLLDPHKPPAFQVEWLPVPVRSLHVWNYADVVQVMTDYGFTRRFPPDWLPLRWLMLVLSGPPTQGRGEKHDQLREAIGHMVSRKVFHRLRDPIQEMANQVIHDAGPAFDLAAIADAFTYRVMCMILDLDAQMWSDESQKVFADYLNKFSDTKSPFFIPGQRRVIRAFRRYVKEQRRIDSDGTRPIDPLLQSVLSKREILATLLLTMFAGTITSDVAICNALGLMQTELDAEQQQAIREDVISKGASSPLLARLYEESLRWHPPVLSRLFRTQWPLELAGHPLGKNQLVTICWPSANRDPEKFDQPNIFDPWRSDVRDHLSFTEGDYSCVGRGLTTLMATSLLTPLLGSSKPTVVRSASPKAGVLLRPGSMWVTRYVR